MGEEKFLQTPIILYKSAKTNLPQSSFKEFLLFSDPAKFKGNKVLMGPNDWLGIELSRSVPHTVQIGNVCSPGRKLRKLSPARFFFYDFMFYFRKQVYLDFVFLS